jgi:hypothetical protein
MHNPVAQMVTHGQVKPRKRKTLLEAAQPKSTRVKALVRCIEERAANSDKVIVELCEEIDRLNEALRKILNTPLGHQEIHDCASAALLSGKTKRATKHA